MPWKRQHGPVTAVRDGGCWGGPLRASVSPPPCVRLAPSLRRPSQSPPAAAQPHQAPTGSPSVRGCEHHGGLSRGSPAREGVLGTVGDDPWGPSPRLGQVRGRFGWERRVSGAAGWAPRYASGTRGPHSLPRRAWGSSPVMSLGELGIPRGDGPEQGAGSVTPPLQGDKGPLGGAGPQGWPGRGFPIPRRAELPGISPGSGGALCQTPRHRLLPFPTGKTPWDFYSAGSPPANHPLSLSAGSLAAMEEGEDGPAGERSPSEREGAASDREGSAERDASSPPGSEGEPRHHGGGPAPGVPPPWGPALPPE